MSRHIEEITAGVRKSMQTSTDIDYLKSRLKIWMKHRLISDDSRIAQALINSYATRIKELECKQNPKSFSTTTPKSIPNSLEPASPSASGGSTTT